MHWWLMIIVMTMLYCEYLANYMIMWQCKWPEPSVVEKDDKVLRAMILADTHLLGPVRGHWLDKLYREWHMSRSFQASMHIHRPDVVFVLGDLFDEGEWVDSDQFTEYVERFHRHFQTPSIPIVSIVGNHDIGFHYKLHPYFTYRFERKFNNTGVNLYTFKDVHFVVINSMAMENDGCEFCEAALEDLQGISSLLNCFKTPKNCKEKQLLTPKNMQYSRPIVMQHFPTYRKSDVVCKERDAPTIEKFREDWEVLSRKSTDLLGELLHPRLAFSGHIHHYCHFTNRWGVDEYSVASFNWRNKVNPSFMLATFTPQHHAVFKCEMLEQETVIQVYLLGSVITLILLGCRRFRKFRICSNIF